MNKPIDTIITSVLELPCNVGPVILTVLLWAFCCYFGYWSTNNFDLISTIEGYIMVTGLISTLIGVLGQKHWRRLIRLGVLTQVAAIFALVAYKSLVIRDVGFWVLSPVSMFCFFMIVKNIWIESEHA